MIPKICGYYGKPIHLECGTYQGDVLSPTLFDIVVDAILREWHHQLPVLMAVLIYYADDGCLAGYSEIELQKGLDLLVDLFAQMGMKFNADKTKAMISVGTAPSRPHSNVAYKRCIADSSLPTY